MVASDAKAIPALHPKTGNPRSATRPKRSANALFRMVPQFSVREAITRVSEAMSWFKPTSHPRSLAQCPHSLISAEKS